MTGSKKGKEEDQGGKPAPVHPRTRHFCSVSVYYLSASPFPPLAGQLYNLKSAYGSKEELVELNKALIAAGIRPGA